MAKKKVQNDDEEAIGKNWREGELIETFHLIRIASYQTPLMKEWLEAVVPEFNEAERYYFDRTHLRGANKIVGWSEEDLKMKFIAPILELGLLVENDHIVTFFDKIISATVENINLRVKADFMIAEGTFNVFRQPYFHFQEYKPQINPTGEPMAQLLEAFLIAQTKNKKELPLYGVEVIGKQWTFVTMEGKEYCISKAFDSTDKESLIKIIAILRKFKEILETRLLFL